MIELLHHSPVMFTVLAGLVGLLVGSFLNVVIHRIPIMMEREWRAQCTEFMGTEFMGAELTDDEPSRSGQNVAEPATQETYNLVVPRSACPKCGHKITALENIPVVSYLFLKGKCAECANPISIRYPLVELLTSVLTALVAWRFGFGIEAIAAIIFTWTLIALSGIDFDTQLLPDSITLPMLWLGLFMSLFHTTVPAEVLFISPKSAIIGALVGYLCLWSVYQAFKLATGKEGMGYGDFKLLAMLGAWLGFTYIPMIILLSAVVGAMVGLSLMIFKQHGREVPIPFGPYLAAAGWVALIWGEPIMQVYKQVSGLE